MLRNLHAITLIILLSWQSLASETKYIIQIHEEAYSVLDSDPEKAFALAEEAEQLAQQKGENYLQAQSLFIKAYVFRQQDDLGKSFVSNLAALELLEGLQGVKSLETHVKILLNTGEILKQHYAYNEAISYYNKGIELASKYNLKERLVRLYYNKATALRHDQRYNEALETVEQALKVAEDINDELRILRALNQKGLILKDQGQLEQARNTFGLIIDFDYQSRSPISHFGQAWHNIGVTYSLEHQYTAAASAFQKSLSYKVEEGDNEDLFITYMDLAEVSLHQNNYRLADSLANLAEPLYEYCPLLPDNYKIFDLRSQIAHHNNNTDRIRAYAQLYFNENSKFLDHQRAILEIKDRYKMEVLTAGFFTQQQADHQQGLLEKVVWWITILFVGIAIITRGLERRKRKNAVLEIRKIEDNSYV